MLQCVCEKVAVNYVSGCVFSEITAVCEVENIIMCILFKSVKPQMHP